MTLVNAETGEIVDDRIRLEDLHKGPQLREGGLNLGHLTVASRRRAYQLADECERVHGVVIDPIAELSA